MAHIGNSEFDIALDIIETKVLNNPVKLNFRRLAYTYALLNDHDKHMNIWETIHDNFEINRYETKFYYELLLKNKFYLKAADVFSIGLKKGFFDEQERYDERCSPRHRNIRMGQDEIGICEDQQMTDEHI